MILLTCALSQFLFFVRSSTYEFWTTYYYPGMGAVQASFKPVKSCFDLQCQIEHIKLLDV
jgi:hypothetical protein